MSRFVWILIPAGLIAASGCEQKPTDRASGTVTSVDVRRDAGLAINTSIEFSQQAKEDLQENLDSQLKIMDAEIAKLREKSRDLKDDAKANWDRKMAELEAKRDAARAKLAEVGQSTAESWKDVQQGAQSAWASAWDELEKAIQVASREF